MGWDVSGSWQREGGRWDSQGGGKQNKKKRISFGVVTNQSLKWHNTFDCPVERDVYELATWYLVCKWSIYLTYYNVIKNLWTLVFNFENSIS